MNEAANLAIPKYNPHHKHRPEKCKPWWNQNEFFRRYQKNKNLENLNNYQHQDVIVKKSSKPGKKTKLERIFQQPK